MESLHNKNQTTSDSQPQEAIPCNPLLVYQIFFFFFPGNWCLCNEGSWFYEDIDDFSGRKQENNNLGKCLVQWIRILYNYLLKFERIRADDRERSLMELTWSNKWLGNPIFIWSSGSHNWSLTITCPKSHKFWQIIIEDLNPSWTHMPI